MSDFTILFLEVGQSPGVRGQVPKQEVKAIVTLPMLAAPGMIQVLQQTIQQHSRQMEEAQKLMGNAE